MFRSTDGSTVLDSKMAPKLTWGWKRRAATVPVAARATPTYIYRRLLKLYFPTCRKMTVPSSSGLNQSRKNWMKAPLSVGYHSTQKHGVASHRTRIFHFFRRFLSVKETLTHRIHSFPWNVAKYPVKQCYRHCTATVPPARCYDPYPRHHNRWHNALVLTPTCNLTVLDASTGTLHAFAGTINIWSTRLSYEAALQNNEIYQKLL